MTMTIAGKDHSGDYVGRGNKKIKKPTPRYLPVDFILFILRSGNFAV